MMQKSVIPLCYSLANNEQATTKLRICTNSSFKVQAKTPSFNECCISGPDYLNCLDSILTRWRFGAKSAHSDISRCYHRISTSLLDNSLHRLWLKPVLGSDAPWEEYCLTKVSFGYILGGCVSTCAIWDTSERFMKEEVRSNLSQNVYMDDIALLQYFDTPGGCDELIRDVD